MKYDAIVVGAGIIGASMALGLAKRGKRVLLLEKSAYPPPLSTDHDLRAYAINLAAEQLFKYLGVWDDIVAGSSPYRQMSIWMHKKNSSMNFSHMDIRHSHLGHIVDNVTLSRSLNTAIANTTQIESLGHVTLTAIEVGDQPRLTLKDQGTVRADVIIGADGAHSIVRELANIDVVRSDYRQQGIVTQVKTALPHEHTAWQCFLPSGCLALLPLANGESSIVWSVDKPIADKLQQLDSDSFLQAITDACESKLGEMTLTRPRVAFPLQQLHAVDYVVPGIALLGDAAHVIHPMAGQGVNLGLMDVATLLEEVQGDVRTVLPWRQLRRYARRRRHANQLMLSGIDALYHLFKATNPVLQYLRQQGIALTDQTPMLKRHLARRAAGLDGDIAKFVRLH